VFLWVARKALWFLRGNRERTQHPGNGLAGMAISHCGDNNSRFVHAEHEGVTVVCAQD